MNNDQVADVLGKIAVLLELKGENPFKTRAYSNAARQIETLNEPLQRIIDEGRLDALRGIGDALQAKIVELISTGRLVYFEELKASIPPGLVEMLDIPGLGPKKVKALSDQLGVLSVEALEKACQENRVSTLKGFGEKTQTNILEGITRRRTYASRHLLYEVQPLAEGLLDQLRQHPAVVRCSTAGSLRRCREVVGDVDLLASSNNPVEVITDFTSLPGLLSIIAKGETKASVLLEGGVQCDLRVVSDAEFPSALMYFTGSKEHNIVMRQRAIERGLRLNEYGLFRSSVETRDPALRIPCPTEEAIFQELGLYFVPPEMREDLGEFQLATAGPLPRLVEWTDLKGSLHNHSTWSDGRQSPVDIAKSMIDLGLAYWGVTDHSKSSFQANGLMIPRLQAQIREVRQINVDLERDGIDFRLLTGTEVDILKDGSLDFPDDVLAELDVVIASVHQGFTLPEPEMTARIIKAIGNPNVHILGHPTGRLLLEREAYAVDQRAVIDACAKNGTWIELNASPSRLDLDWRLWAYAKSRGVKCVINCDAHKLEHAAFLRLGAGLARKAGLTREDIVNTWPLDKLKKALQEKRNRTR